MLVFILVSVLAALVLTYHRASLVVWTLSFGLLLVFITNFLGLTVGVLIAWFVYLAFSLLLNIKPLRRRLISQPAFSIYRNMMPTLSKTEREAISAGTVSWEADVFRGTPDWQKLHKLPSVRLSSEEEAFLNGPVDMLCRMIDDWSITHDLADLPASLWEFIKKEGFFGLIIPQHYGGKGFSAFAHSEILAKISGRSITVSSTIAVPNSLGPAELLLHYGTEEQKNYYLPRLATGDEIPCFALTSPDAGSDASAMNDYGVVGYGEYKGQKILGIRLNWDKRYITLAPIATVIGLAFKLYDPEHLIGTKVDIGITCALIPRDTPGIQIGRRHFPLNTPFMNGPIKGTDVFVPLDYIIGGEGKAGKGWRMLMECLAAGRAISLPASALGNAKVMAYAAGAYARIRKQFNMPIGRFEGIEEALARIGAYTYIMDAGRRFAAAAIDMGEKPSVASAIVKYHVTEFGRKIALDGMDIHGGKGICLGPRNYLGRPYESTPIAITVEGANILTRSLIIFGQGAIRCHPYILVELEAAKASDEHVAITIFDRAFIKHVAFSFSNLIKTFILGLTSSRIVQTPTSVLHRYYQHASRFSAALALISDASMLVLGSRLKRKESLSGRLGDILSHLYLISAIFKKYKDEGELEEDFPIVKYACDYCLHQIQDSFIGLIQNFPHRSWAIFLKCVIFPFGHYFLKPRDQLNHKISQLLMGPTGARLRLSKGAFLSNVKENILADLEDGLIKIIAAEPIEKLINAAKHDGLITGHATLDLSQQALEKGIINKEQFEILMKAHAARQKIIAVDDFTTEALARVNESNLSLEENI